MEIKKPITAKYMRSYSELYGNATQTVSKPKKRKINTHPTERQEQTVLCVWMDKNRILYYAIPNGGSRHYLEAINLKRTGVKAGVPDLCIPLARNGYHGLYIELKRISGGKVSDEQTFWMEALQAEGYKVEIAYGAEQAKQIVRDYLNVNFH
jgi:hypothetical protein